MNNTTQTPIFYCDKCDKYLNQYMSLMDIGGPYYKCKCGNEVYPEYPSDRELRKMKLKRING